VPAIRRLLERVLADKLGWKPHPKSRSLGELATHYCWSREHDRIAITDEFAPGSLTLKLDSVEEIRSRFD
jgi:hypothetical protein